MTPDGVVVAPSDKMFQGQSGPLAATITITNQAGGLSNPMVVDFGGLQGFVTAASSNDTTLVIKASVPHGTTLGKRTLKVSTVGGLITLADVVEVTAIYAGPNGLDTNVGSSDSPFRSLKQAIAVADIGDTIQLIDGHYSALPVASGGSAETWGYTLPTNVTIVGDSTAGTILDGKSSAANINGFDVAQTLTLQNLTLKHFRYGVYVKAPASSTFTMTDVAISGNSTAGIYFDSASAGSTVNFSGTNGSISQPGSTFGVNFNTVNNATLNITDATVSVRQPRRPVLLATPATARS